MKINISRQNIYLLSLSIFLLIFVLFFAFVVLIPEGKEYRTKRATLNKVNRELRKYKAFEVDVLEKLNELKTKNRNIIKALSTEFNAYRFEKQHKIYFNSLKISLASEIESTEDFSVYEVQTISKINSPKSFYDFLDAVNKSDWIISINFPISFKREEEIIQSTFTMKVFSIPKDMNSSKEVLIE